MARTTSSSRWLTVIAVALLCSIAVVIGLIQITGQSPESSSTPPASTSAGASATEGSSATSPEPGAGAAAGEGSEQGTAPTTTSSTPAPQLPGSGLSLPAAWTGTADLTITVLGRCASTGGTSSYTRSAELALQAPLVGATPLLDDPNPLSMTLGITPADVPGLSLYSASADPSGGIRRTWWLATGTDPQAPDRTLISGVLIDDQPVRGRLPPNLLTDSETDLQPCESRATIRLPRTLAAGSVVTGWLSPSQGQLDVTATTTDGERAVKATVSLSRTPGP